MSLLLGNPRRKVALGLICVAVAAAQIAAAAWQLRVSRDEISSEPDRLQRAAQLAPNDSEPLLRLGAYYLTSAQDAPSAIRFYRRAVVVSPFDSRGWLGLATANMLAGDSAGQRDALLTAVEVDPRTPAVAWMAGNMFVAAGDTAAALPHFQSVLQSHLYTRETLEICYRVTGDVRLMLRDIVPPNAFVYVTFLRLLSAQDRNADAAVVWEALLGLKQHVSAPDTFPYIAYLMRHHPEQAWRAWLDLPKIDATFGNYIPDNSLVVNGGFDEAILNDGFDWRIQSQDGIQAALDTTQFHGGRRALALDFADATGDPVVSEYVLLQPGRKYRFSAWWKGDELISASGLRFSLLDATSKAEIMTSQEMSGSSAWAEIDADFTNRADTTLAILRLSREHPADVIKGRLWIDDVVLQPR